MIKIPSVRTVAVVNGPLLKPLLVVAPNEEGIFIETIKKGSLADNAGCAVNDIVLQFQHSSEFAKMCKGKTSILLKVIRKIFICDHCEGVKKHRAKCPTLLTTRFSCEPFVIADDDETPSEIAERNGWKVNALLKANQHIRFLQAGAKLYEGTKLFAWGRW